MNLFKKNINNSNKDYSFSTSKEERDDFCANIINSSSPQPGFYFLLAVAAFIVAVGIIRDSLVLLIGGMLVAPLLSPLLAISLSLSILNVRVFIRSILIFIISALVSLIVAIFIGAISDFDLYNLEILDKINVFGPATLLVPLAAGAAASFAWSKKNLSGALPGAAVTVTLLPPLVIMGLALAVEDMSIFTDSLYVYLLNVGGIIIGGLIIFAFMGFHRSRKVVLKQVELEAKENNE